MPKEIEYYPNTNIPLPQYESKIPFLTPIVKSWLTLLGLTSVGFVIGGIGLSLLFKFLDKNGLNVKNSLWSGFIFVPVLSLFLFFIYQVVVNRFELVKIVNVVAALVLMVGISQYLWIYSSLVEVEVSEVKSKNKAFQVSCRVGDEYITARDGGGFDYHYTFELDNLSGQSYSDVRGIVEVFIKKFDYVVEGRGKVSKNISFSPNNFFIRKVFESGRSLESGVLSFSTEDVVVRGKDLTDGLAKGKKKFNKEVNPIITLTVGNEIEKILICDSEIDWYDLVMSNEL